MVPTRVTGPLWTHAGGCRSHIVDLDLLVPSPCLWRPGEEVELAPDPPGRIGKNLGCSTPRTVLFQDLEDTQEAWEPPLREMVASSMPSDGRGSASEPIHTCEHYHGFGAPWERFTWGRYHPHSHWSGQGTLVLSSKTAQELGGWGPGP